MNIDTKNIEKLKIINVYSNYLQVENPQSKRGSIYISEVSKSYIVDLESLYKPGDIVYGYLYKKEKNKMYYSLKIGHTSTSKYVHESGGGSLALLYYLTKNKKR